MASIPLDSPSFDAGILGALSGLKVLDLSRVLAGPYAAQMLADHGADVIKVEPPQGDETRELGPPFVGDNAAYFQGVNRNKRAISLDLAELSARDVLLRLLIDADILIENFLPGTMKKWGLSYEMLQARFPRLIYCQISGFGDRGPLSFMPGYDAVLQAFCGLMSTNGHMRSGPTRIGTPIVDIATGLSSVIGILLALVERERSGQGQLVNASLFDTALGLLHPHASNWLASGTVPTLTGNAHPNISPYDTFPAKDGELFLGVVNDGQFRRFCDSVGRSDLLTDPRFKSNRSRVENRAALRAEIEVALQDRELLAICQQLTEVGVCASPINSVADVLQHPHTLARDMIVELEGYRGVGVPIKLSRTPASVRKRPPEFAEDALSILSMVGYQASEIEDLTFTGASPLKRRENSR